MFLMPGLVIGLYTCNVLDKVLFPHCSLWCPHNNLNCMVKAIQHDVMCQH
jgi:hypothetical protein